MLITRQNWNWLIAVAVAAASLSSIGSQRARASFTIPSGNPLTATMDSGTTVPGNPAVSNTWYQIGYNAAAPTTGLPSNTVFTSQTNGNISYRTPSFASGNDAALLSGASVGNVPTDTITFATPVSASTANFTFLTAAASAGGSPQVALTLNLVGGGTFAVTPLLFSPGWFDSYTNIAFTANGRVSQTGLNNVNSGFPRLFDGTVATGYTGGAQIAGITISATGIFPGNGNVAVFAVSGSTNGTTYSPITLNTSSFNQSLVATPVPEPTALGLVGLGVIGLIARRRRLGGFANA